MTGDALRRRDMPGLVVGLAIIAAGILFTLDNLNILRAGRLVQYWPLVLVAVGFARLTQADSWVRYAWDVALIVAGLWLTAENLGLVTQSLWELWPLALVLVGLSIARRAVVGPPRTRGHRRPVADGWTGDPAGEPAGEPPPTAEPAAAPGAATFDSPPRSRDSHVPMTAVMGAYERATDTTDFRSANLTAIMAGCTLDLRQAEIAGDEAVIDVLAIMGGIEIYVPQHWAVESRVLPLMGGLGDETHPIRNGGTRRLVVRGVAFMGGIEIKN